MVARHRAHRALLCALAHGRHPSEREAEPRIDVVALFVGRILRTKGHGTVEVKLEMMEPRQTENKTATDATQRDRVRRAIPVPSG